MKFIETSLADIQRQAYAAAQQFDDVNAACPYPFGTFLGREFRREFNNFRALLEHTEGKDSCEK